MRDPVSVEIEERTFQIAPMPILEARKWDFKIGLLLAPLLGALDGLSNEDAKPTDEELVDAIGGDIPEKELSGGFEKVGKALQEALKALPDDQMLALLKGLFSKVTYVPTTGGAKLLSNDAAINDAFDGCGPLALYKLAFEVARYNKFTPFALAGDGGPISGILGSLKSANRKRGLDLDRLAG